MELQVAGAFQEIASGNDALAKTVATLKFSAAKDFEVSSNCKAVALFVPVPQINRYRSVQVNLINALEKKFANCHFLIIANRTMVAPSVWARSQSYTGVRPRSRTLKAVQEAVLDDIVYPANITGKRTRVRLDQSRLMRVFLPKSAANDFEHKVNTFEKVYKDLTSKDVEFSFA